MTARSLKYAFIERLVVPIALLIVKLLIRTYRLGGAMEELRAAVLAHPRILIATCHGMFIALLPFVRHYQSPERKLCVMTSPSRDGKLLDTVLESLEIMVVKGSSKSRSVAGAVALVDAMKKGHMGLLAVDGPKGPVGVPKAGCLRLAPAADAVMLVAVVSSKYYIRFRSWDRLFMPLPFSRIDVRVHLYKPDASSPECELQRLQDCIASEARAICCPIFDPSESKPS